jgi:hypothetical protein
VRGKGSKVGELCPKVRLSQDRLPIEPSFFLSLSQAYSVQMSFAQMSLNRVLYIDRLDRFANDKCLSVLGPSVSYEENEVL